ncbi:MAG: hypothetical protein ABIS67_12740 [Candidatus Eisenbacteria bacterium]
MAVLSACPATAAVPADRAAGAALVMADSAGVPPPSSPVVPATVVPAPSTPESLLTATPPPRVVAGCADGEKDADTEHSTRGYGVAGLLTGPIGVVLAARSNPKPHGPKAVALTPESAPEYGRCYAKRARKRNLRSAVNGFAVATFAAITVNYFLESKTAP